VATRPRTDGRPAGRPRLGLAAAPSGVISIICCMMPVCPAGHHEVDRRSIVALREMQRPRRYPAVGWRWAPAKSLIMAASG